MLATSTATAMTLMACYGMPPEECEEGQDFDNDGYDACSDCADDDETSYPGADDPAGDDIDQNCDGVDGILDETGGAPPAGGAPAGGAPAGGAPAGGAPAGGAGGAG